MASRTSSSDWPRATRRLVEQLAGKEADPVLSGRYEQCSGLYKEPVKELKRAERNVGKGDYGVDGESASMASMALSACRKKEKLKLERRGAARRGGSNRGVATMADVDDVAAPGQPKKRTFKKFSFRGVDLDALLDMSTDELVKLFPARARRRFQRGLKRKPMALIKKLRKAKREAPPGEKPEPVRTHLRNMIIVPEMIGSIIGVYNGKTFNQVEIKPEMISHYLAEFSISYKPVKHGRPGIGATHSSRFIPLK
ncbi:hypothetical protein MLD38_023674 [Melastoma candidum]|uniref:Uncharacterized protein n=1 Tax=Melastoma candidum TaxID=119954 RepID=A0ACB9NUW0_9MYRT|nr:hypothetical protein MLD38_023674 [Melastoma candidum]